MKNVFGSSLLVMAVATAAGVTAAAMAQDECSTAGTVAANSSVTFNTTNATPSAGVPDPNQCPGTFLDWGTGNRDVWFKFTPTDDGVATFSTCDAASFDTSMVLYTGSCNALTQVACNGDGVGGSGCQAFYSRIADFPVLAGTDYYVRIGGWNGVEFGAGTLAVAFTAIPAGCLGATGDCAQPHGAPGCADANCCSAVCNFDFICCDVGWDESCVSYAIELCGIFVHRCDSPNPGVPNDCAPNANVVSGDSSRTFNVTGCNTDGPNHPGATCNSGNDFFFYDVWYRGQATANGSLRVNTCNNATFDTKLAVYALGTNPSAFDYDTLPDALVGCNDDGSADCQVNATYASDLSVNVAAGQWYLIRVASYDNPGSGTVFFDWPEPCAMAANNATEAEACGTESNAGCNAGGAVETITTSSVVKGTFWKTTDAAGAATRDVDFYAINITQEASYTFSVKSANFAQLLVIGGDIAAANCAGISVINTGTGSCPTSASACLNPGTYYVFVGIPFTAADTACGNGLLNQYTLEVSSSPAQCPTLIDNVCDVVGPNTATINSSLATGNGIVRCASQPAFPNCGQGGTGANKYARSFPAGAATGQITCLNFGVWSVVRAANAANTACGLFLSGLPLPATIGIYKDLDGGDPRNIIASAGDGNDLEALRVEPVLIPGVAGVMTVNFDPPLCLDGTSGNKLVVVLEFPSLLDGTTPGVPANAGYQQLAGGNTANPGSAAFIRLSCADAAGQFIIAESLGATFTARWVVTLNGDFSGCGSDCPADLDGDGSIGALDLASLLAAWGSSGAADLDGDGSVGALDLAALLAAWGQCQ